MNASVATKTKPPETTAAPSTQRKKIEIEPNKVTLDHGGHVRRYFVIHLPDGMIADDLREPSLFARVQRSANALKRHDVLYMMAADQTWSADALVSEAWSGGVTLAGIRIIKTPQRVSSLFRDETYEVTHQGHGLYCVTRLSDGHKMTKLVASANIAERDLRNLYPQKVGA